MKHKSSKKDKSRHRRPAFDPGPPGTHLFYLDAGRNAEPPPTWFFDILDDSRLRAEQLLTMGRRYGNVLMRTSTSFPGSGKYVISMRREVAGGTKLDHYEVIKTPDGYKINVDNKHGAMRCLSEVMEFFVSVAGPGTQTMKTNNQDKIFGRIVDDTISEAPPLSPGPSWSPQTMPSGGQRKNSIGDNWSARSPTSRTSGKLNIAGNVPEDMRSAVQDLNYDPVRNDRSSMSSSIPPSHAPPPPTHEPPIDYQGGIDYVNIAGVMGGQNQSYGMATHDMPARSMPTQTLQRVTGGQMDQQMSYNQNTMSYGGGVSSAPPPAPPPLPGTGAVPPPPPPIGNLGGGGMPSSSPGFSTARPAQTYHEGINNNFNTSPAGGQSRFGGSNKVQSLQDELLGKLKRRKEDIYATAQILKSNY